MDLFPLSPGLCYLLVSSPLATDEQHTILKVGRIVLDRRGSIEGQSGQRDVCVGMGPGLLTLVLNM